MCRYEQASESGLRAEVDHKSSLTVYTHAGWIQSTCEYIDSLIQLPPDI